MSNTFENQKRIFFLKKVISDSLDEIRTIELNMNSLPIWENVSTEGILNEIWLPVEGYEKYYEVSNMGRVKSLSRFVDRKRNGKPSTFITREKILIPHKEGDGYHKIYLYVEGKMEYAKLHRLVASHFINNPDNKPEVNHKNGIKKDNRANNLEWATKCENMQHAFDTGLNKTRKDWTEFGEKNPKSKPVEQLTMSGEYIQTFAGQTEAQRITGVDQASIGRCCIGKQGYAGAFKWKYPEGVTRGVAGAVKGSENYSKAKSQ